MPHSKHSIGVADAFGRPLYEGDAVLYRLVEGTSPEYRNPVYRIIWVPPTYTLNRIAGGKDTGSHEFKLKYGGGNGALFLCNPQLQPIDLKGRPFNPMTDTLMLEPTNPPNPASALDEVKTVTPPVATEQVIAKSIRGTLKDLNRLMHEAALEGLRVDLVATPVGSYPCPEVEFYEATIYRRL